MLVVLSVIGVLALLQVLAGGSGDVDGRTAPPGSTYSTNGDGHKALRQLLTLREFTVDVVRIGFAEAPPDPTTTVFVVSGDALSEDDQAALHTFVEDGGRLIIADQPVDGIVGSALTTGFSSVDRLEVAFPYGGLESVGEVVAPDARAFIDPGPLLGVIGSPDRPTVGVLQVDGGIVWAIADPSILSNDALDQADNAALALAMAGDTSRPVLFAEYTHGYGPLTGLASLPGSIQAGLWIAALAGIVWMVSRGRRLGPPEGRSRPLAPPRVAYVDAMAANLSRAKDLGAATTPIRERVQRELHRRGGNGEAELARIADQLGLTADDVRKALMPPEDAASAVAAGAVLAKLSKNRI